MDREKAINIAIGCIMASGLDEKIAREAIEALKEIKED
jgi:hypothetical protein